MESRDSFQPDLALAQAWERAVAECSRHCEWGLWGWMQPKNGEVVYEVEACWMAWLGNLAETSKKYSWWSIVEKIWLFPYQGLQYYSKKNSVLGKSQQDLGRLGNHHPKLSPQESNNAEIFECFTVSASRRVLEFYYTPVHSKCWVIWNIHGIENTSNPNLLNFKAFTTYRAPSGTVYFFPYETLKWKSGTSLFLNTLLKEGRWTERYYNGSSIRKWGEA